jgi:voltage-gated potassium channel
VRKISATTIITSLAAVIAAGTVFFRYVEGWGWLDSYFFTVVTISTVGYGSLVPATAIGKIATTALIFIGLGIFAVAIREFGEYSMRKREEHTEWLIARLGHFGHSRHVEDPPAANEDDPPVTITDQPPRL